MAISGPIAPYSNPPIEPQWYQPRRYEIQNVILGVTTIVTATLDLDYTIGQEVRLLIPKGYGCVQLSGKTGYVISLPTSASVEIDINSGSGVNQFVAAGLPNVPQIIAIGDINSGAINFGRTNNITFVEGSFINISPTP